MRRQLCLLSIGATLFVALLSFGPRAIAMFGHGVGMMMSSAASSGGGTPGNIACDVGPNATAVPTPVQNAWGVHAKCALYALFTDSSGVTVPGGWVMTNKNTFVHECGATGQFQWHWSLYIASTSLNCADITVTSDTGVSPTVPQVLYINYPAAEFNANPGTNGNGAGFSYPGVSYATVCNVPCFPSQHYIEVKYRITTAGWQQDGSRSGHTAWDAPGRGITPSGGFIGGSASGDYIETDYFEATGGLNTDFGGGIAAQKGGVNASCVTQPSGRGGCVTFYVLNDLNTRYHVLSALVTSDTTTGTYYKCTWVDGGFVNGVGAQSVGPNCGEVTGLQTYVPSTQHDTPVTFQMNGLNYPNPAVPTLTNNVEAYIQYVQVWTCDSWRTGTCPGTVLYGPDGTGLAYFH